MCVDCKNNCIEVYSDKCVQYNGQDIPFLNIKSGEFYDSIVLKLINKLQEELESPVDLSCISDKEDLSLSESLSLIVNKICMLTSEDITYNGDYYCIGSDSISSGAVLMIGNSFTYSISESEVGSNVSYDLSDIVRSVPDGFRVSRVNAVISGTPKSGRSIIADSNNTFMGINVSNDRFPVNLDLDVRVTTPNGDVKLSRSISIPTPKTGSYSAEMSVRDFGTTRTEGFTVSDFNELIALQVCDNKTRLDQLDNLDIQGCSYLSYGNNDIKSILATNSAVLCQLIDRVTALENSSSQPCIEGC